MRSTRTTAELVAEIQAEKRAAREDAALDLSWTEGLHDAVGDAFPEGEQ